MLLTGSVPSASRGEWGAEAVIMEARDSDGWRFECLPPTERGTVEAFQKDGWTISSERLWKFLRPLEWMVIQTDECLQEHLEFIVQHVDAFNVDFS